MSRLKPRPPMPNLFDLINKTTTRMDEERIIQIDIPSQESGLEPRMTVAVAQEKIPVAVRNIMIPKFWPNMKTKIMVPAHINWVRPINETEYEAGITFMGKYPYNSDCSSIWLLKKIGDKFIPVCDLLNNYKGEIKCPD